MSLKYGKFEMPERIKIDEEVRPYICTIYRRAF